MMNDWWFGCKGLTGKWKKYLKGLIEEMKDEVLANAGVDVFEVKFIFT